MQFYIHACWALNQKGYPPKVLDDLILKYLRKYKGLNKKDIWKIMVKDGYELLYNRFLRRIKKLKEKGRIIKVVK